MKTFSSQLISFFSLISLFSAVHSQTVWNSPIALSVSSNWGSGLCGNIQFTNPSTTQTVHSFIISMKICNGAITTSWGGGLSSLVTYKDSTTQIWQFQGQNVWIGPGNTYSDIGLCLSNELSFDVSTSVSLGVDLFPGNTLGCSGLECALTCGDGLCATCESEANCPIDCKPNQCVATLASAGNVWTGKASIVVTSWSWGSLCGNVYVENPSATATAISHVLTLQICAKTAQISSFWGYDQQMVAYDSVQNTFRQVANNVIYQPHNSYNVGGFCMYVTNSFDLNKHLKVGVDVRDKNNLCTSATCVPICGDGKCDGNETASNCTPDCAPLNCSV